METRGFWRLEGVSDSVLQSELAQLLASGHRTEARIVAHIAEVDRRELFLKEGFSALYKYCQVRLGLSENESFHRMTAARIASEYPVVFGLIEQRKIHLSGLCMLRNFLTRANHHELLQEACGKTKRQLEELLAVKFPGKQSRDFVRRLPTNRVRALSAPPAQSLPLQCVQGDDSVGIEKPRSADAMSVSALGISSSESIEVVDPVTGEVTTRPAPIRVGSAHTTPMHGDARLELPTLDSRESNRATPDSTAGQQPRYRVQFDASSALKARIDLAKALDSHANPKGDLGLLFERALEIYVEHLQKKRFAKTERSRKPSGSATSEPGQQHVRRQPGRTAYGRQDLRSTIPGDESLSTGEKTKRELERATPAECAKSSRKHLPHETRRSVVAKDGLSCAFVSPTGQRCNEQAFLQFHHEEPWARAQDDRPRNLHLYCSAHNRFRAEQDFGAEYVARRIDEASARKATVNAARVQRCVDASAETGVVDTAQTK